jgi:predicted TIM-barrel fold metal-dependent hydrolase
MDTPVAELIKEYEALPLKESVQQKWFYDNAARVFGTS